MSDGVAAPQNRYRDVIPCKLRKCKNYFSFFADNKNRIRLEDNEPNGDYINASLIEYPGVDRRYIAAQAPLTTTIDDFWLMIGQYKVRVVVMLCKVVENSVVS
jgi:protein tyrosine phosphatase